MGAARAPASAACFAIPGQLICQAKPGSYSQTGPTPACLPAGLRRCCGPHEASRGGQHLLGLGHAAPLPRGGAHGPHAGLRGCVAVDALMGVWPCLCAHTSGVYVWS